MPRQSFVLLTVLIVLSVLLAACASQGGGGAAPTAIAVIPTETPRPTSTSTPEPTATATQTPEPTLTPTATAVPTPTEMPLPEWMQPFLSMMGEYEVKEMSGAAYVTRKLASGETCKAFIRENGEWRPFYEPALFINADGTYKLDDSRKCQFIRVDVFDGLRPNQDDYARMRDALDKVWGQTGIMNGEDPNMYGFIGNGRESDPLMGKYIQIINNGTKTSKVQWKMKMSASLPSAIKGQLAVFSTENGDRLFLIAIEGMEYSGGTAPISIEDFCQKISSGIEPQNIVLRLFSSTSAINQNFSGSINADRFELARKFIQGQRFYDNLTNNESEIKNLLRSFVGVPMFVTFVE
ncbi:MAG TPA: hypothetical protein PKW33_11750 [Anaerolineaceae bacterium]|nr:hypothetical protein [Anaerolineaceae bacterium]HPN52253.1 hypothetical protein [Anaerolineaceae bacterium]